MHITTASMNENDVRIDILLVPRSIVIDGLARLKASHVNVSRITIDDLQGTETDPDFAPELIPALKWRRLLWATPCFALLLAANFTLTNIDSRRDVLASNLEAQLVVARKNLAALADEAIARREAKANFEALYQRRKQTFALHEVLNFIAQQFPVSANIQRIEGRSGQIRTSVGGDDIVSLVAHINDMKTDWAASVDGAINSMELSGSQVANIILREK